MIQARPSSLKKESSNLALFHANKGRPWGVMSYAVASCAIEIRYCELDASTILFLEGKTFWIAVRWPRLKFVSESFHKRSSSFSFFHLLERSIDLHKSLLQYNACCASFPMSPYVCTLLHDLKCSEHRLSMSMVEHLFSRASMTLQQWK